MVFSLLGQKVSVCTFLFVLSSLSLCWAVTGTGHDSALPQHSHRLHPFPPVYVGLLLLSITPISVARASL